MLRDPAFFWRPNNTASRGRGGGKNRSATTFRKNAPKYAIFSTVLSKIVDFNTESFKRKYYWGGEQRLAWCIILSSEKFLTSIWHVNMVDGWLFLLLKEIAKLLLFIPRYNTTTYRRHSLRYVGPVIWSKLSKDVKNAESIYSFKKKIRKVDLEQVITEGCKNCFLCCT